MTQSAHVLARFDVRRWAIASAPRALLPVLLTVEIIPIVILALAFAGTSPTLHEYGVIAIMVAVALVFEEFVSRAARLQLRLSADLKRDMTSVWGVSAAVSLSPAAAAIPLAIVLVYLWFRQHRPAGEVLFRKTFNFANALTSCLTAAIAVGAVRDADRHLPMALEGTVVVCVAIVVYTAVNRLVTTAALLALGVRGRALIGSRDANLIEFATLCLGGLVAVATLYQPLLAILVLAPMVTLHRGAVVRELEAAATTDSKTGLMNAVAWEEIAQRELARAARRGETIAVLIIDIDHFKRVNDRFGHLAGDSVLRRLARTLSAEVREYDTVARFGGEEFVAVLPSASTSEALVIAERLRTKVNELRMSDIVGGLAPALDDRLAVSIGVATAPMDGVELPDLLHAADGALYVAKDRGRNRVELADSGRGDVLQTLPFA